MKKLTSAHYDRPITEFMVREFAGLGIDQTVDEALRSIRGQSLSSRIIYFYVLDAAGKLRGVVPTRRLLLAAGDVKIADLMVDHVIAIPHVATVIEACEFFTMHRLLAFPVVDESGKLLGVVDVQLYTDEMGELEKAARVDDLFQLIGVHLADARQASPWLAFWARVPWLTCNMVGGVLAAGLASLYEVELKRSVALALFIPVTLALAESVGIQSVSLALESLKGNRPTFWAMVSRLRRELVTGAMLGAASGGIVALVALVWLWNYHVVLCVLAGIGGGVMCAAAVGVATPNLLFLLRRDPHVASGPVALALADMATLVVYFQSARLLIP